MTSNTRRIAWLLSFGAFAVLGAVAVKRVLILRAHRYLVRALDVVETHHVRRGQIDWESVRAETYQRSAGALTPAQTHAAILFLLARIGDHHSGLIEPELVKGLNQLTAADNPPPEGRFLPDRMGYLRIRSFVGTNETAIRDEALNIQHAISDVDHFQPCGWIVDLRANGGGNMWPMLSGLAPLLGDGALGAFVSADGTSVTWSLADGHVREGRTTRAAAIPSYRLQTQFPPVALLLGHATASSGEAVAVAFRGRPTTRSFGVRTGGHSTSNEQFPLSDGAVLNLSVSTFADRNGRLYPDGVEPDVATEGQDNSIPVTAREWLLKQNSCSR